MIVKSDLSDVVNSAKLQQKIILLSTAQDY